MCKLQNKYGGTYFLSLPLQAVSRIHSVAYTHSLAETWLYISTHSLIMQKFAILLLAASFALLGALVPVEAAFLPKRETNGHRFARGLPPLPPTRRSPTEGAWMCPLKTDPSC